MGRRMWKAGHKFGYYVMGPLLFVAVLYVALWCAQQIVVALLRVAL